MTDDLDTKTDAQISEIFAVEVAGWVKDKDAPDGENLAGYPISYATSADAVMPWLEEYLIEESHEISYCENGMGDNEVWRIYIADESSNYNLVLRAEDASFARAACIALIRAKRAEKGAVK